MKLFFFLGSPSQIERLWRGCSCKSSASLCQRPLVCRHSYHGLSCPSSQLCLPTVWVHVASWRDEKESTSWIVLFAGRQKCRKSVQYVFSFSLVENSKDSLGSKHGSSFDHGVLLRRSHRWHRLFKVAQNRLPLCLQENQSNVRWNDFPTWLCSLWSTPWQRPGA